MQELDGVYIEIGAAALVEWMRARAGVLVPGHRLVASTGGRRCLVLRLVVPAGGALEHVIHDGVEEIRGCPQIVSGTITNADNAAVLDLNCTEQYAARCGRSRTGEDQFSKHSIEDILLH